MKTYNEKIILKTEDAKKQAQIDFVEYRRKNQKISLLGIISEVEPDNVAEVLWNTDIEYVSLGILPPGKEAAADILKNKIYVAPSDNLQRQRFSLAHEVGHISLHTSFHKNKELNDSKTLEIAEFQANAYASSLLIPDVLFKEIEGELLKLSLSEKIYKLQKFFNVSQQCAEIFLKNYGISKAPSLNEIEELDTERIGWEK